MKTAVGVEKTRKTPVTKTGTIFFQGVALDICDSWRNHGSSWGAPVTSTAPGLDKPHQPTPCDSWSPGLFWNLKSIESTLNAESLRAFVESIRCVFYLIVFVTLGSPGTTRTVAWLEMVDL